MAEIRSTMTIREAAVVWTDPLRVQLQRWADTFEVPLAELHIGHIRTYQADRSREMPTSVVDTEVVALLELLIYY